MRELRGVEMASLGWNKNDQAIIEKAKPMAYVGVAIGAIFVLGFLALICTFQVPPGFVGLISTFGTIDQSTYQPGFHLKMPWQEAIVMETRTIELKETADTPTDQGLSVTLEASVLYHIDPNQAPDIYRKLGPNYASVVIEPSLRSVLRGVTAGYDAKSLYTSDRDAVQLKISTDLEPILASRGIILEKVLLRSITLPPTVAESIQAKLISDQQAQQMSFVIEKEKKEAERKIIEAGGIAESQTIIDRSLTPEYLQWYWISSLGKYDAIAYIPIGNNGLPIFKDVDSLNTLNQIDESTVN
jgi:regulator of protease activity HflC (stomatin/prohibitin superfamily)